MNGSLSLRRGLTGLLLGITVLSLAATPATLAAPVQGLYNGQIQKAAAWILSQQQPDGSFPGFGVGSTADAVFGLVAAGAAGNPAQPGGTTALDYLAGKAAGYAKTPGAAAKLVLAIVASGENRDVHNFGGVDLLKVIADSYDAGSGHYGKDVTGQALVMLALSVLNQSGLSQAVPPAAGDWLVKVQGAEGGWAFDGSTGPGSADTNTTGLVLQALAVAPSGHGLTSGLVQKAAAYFHAQQNDDGGFAYQKAAGTASDANSTALVIMGLRQIDGSPEDAAWHKGGVGPLEFLSRLQNASGAFRYQAAQADDNAGATYQAVPGLAQIVFPIVRIVQGGEPPGPPGSSGAPGMPTTGSSSGPAWPLAALFAALALLGGGLRIVQAGEARD